MAARTVEQRAWLERRLHELPELRQAMREGRLSYEKARLVAGCADDASVKAWIERAEKSTCIALKREIKAREERQTCARGEIDLRLPRRVGFLVGAAFRAAREAAGRSSFVTAVGPVGRGLVPRRQLSRCKDQGPLETGSRAA